MTKMKLLLLEIIEEILMMKKYVSKTFIFSVIVFVAFFFSFAVNGFGIVNKWLFYEFDPISESLVLGRLDKNKRDGGFLSDGGFTGRFKVEKYNTHESINKAAERFFKNEPPVGEFELYLSQPGGQVFIYSILDKSLPFNNEIKLQIYRFLNCVFGASCLTMFLLWVYKNYNIFSVVTTFLLLLFSPILTSMSHSFWWVLGSYFLPFLTVLLLLDKKQKNPLQVSNRKIYYCLFLAMFLKCFLTGFEFITATMFAVLIPFIYYDIINKEKFKETIKKLFFAGTSSMLAVFVVMCILVYQFKILKNSFVKGVEHILFSFTKWNAPVDVIVEIKHDDFVNDVLLPLLRIKAIAHDGLSMHINMLGVFVLIFISCVVLYVLDKKNIKDSEVLRTNKALIVTTCLSFVAPLSWYILFKGHVIIHPFYDYITFYVPSFLLGFLTIGQAIWCSVNYMVDRINLCGK